MRTNITVSMYVHLHSFPIVYRYLNGCFDFRYHFLGMGVATVSRHVKRFSVTFINEKKLMKR